MGVTQLLLILFVQSCILFPLNINCNEVTDFEKICKEYNIEAVIHEKPQQMLQMTFENKMAVVPGGRLRQKDVSNAPTSMTWDADPTAMYTVIGVDPDAPTPGQVLHLLTTNIVGNDYNTGDVISRYVSPSPPDKEHRYIFSVFKQQGRIKDVVEKLVGFNVEDYMERNNCVLEALNFFTVTNDGTQIEVVKKKKIL